MTKSAVIVILQVLLLVQGSEQRLEKPGGLDSKCGQLDNALYDLTKGITSKLPRLPHLLLINYDEFVTTREGLQEDLHLLQETFLGLSPETQKSNKESYTCFRKLIEAKLNDGDDLQEDLVKERISRVVDLIQPPRLGEAEVAFMLLNDNTNLHPILERLHDDKLDTHRDGMTAFLSILHTYPLRLEAFQKWLSLLISSEEHFENTIIILKELLDTEIASNPPSAIKAELEQMQTQVDGYTASRIRAWYRDISAGRQESVIDFVSPNFLHMVGYTFRDLLPPFIDDSLHQPSEFPVVLSFIRALRWNSQKLEGLTDLLNRAQTPDQRLAVAVAIKEAMTHLTGPDPAGPVLGGFEQLKLNLPIIIQRLVWGGECRLKNVGKPNEFLYADEALFGDASSRHAYTTLVSGGNLPEASLFQIIPKIEGDSVTFNLFNSAWPQMWLDSQTETGTFPRDVSLKKDPSAFRWKVEVDIVDDSVKFIHVPTNARLSTTEGSPPDGKRSVMIVQVNLGLNNDKWELDCGS